MSHSQDDLALEIVYKTIVQMQSSTNYVILQYNQSINLNLMIKPYRKYLLHFAEYSYEKEKMS